MKSGFNNVSDYCLPHTLAFRDIIKLAYYGRIISHDAQFVCRVFLIWMVLAVNYLVYRLCSNYLKFERINQTVTPCINCANA